MDSEGGVFRFSGEIESITDGSLMWIRGEDLTIPVSLEKTKCFLLPKNEENEIADAPEQIRWDRVSTLTEGVKVYIGGRIKKLNNRLNFISTKENPLIVIFYNCHETELTREIIRCARARNEYWNGLTPASIALGALSLIIIAAFLLNRPAFRVIVIGALVAAFIPILPVIPPGLLLTTLYRRLMYYSKLFRAYRDLAGLPALFLKNGQERFELNTSETYGRVKLDSIPAETEKTDIPFLIPDSFAGRRKREYYFFGVIPGEDNKALPVKSKDPFVSYGILPASPESLTRRYAFRARVTETLAWLTLLAGVFLNIVFIFIVLYLLGGL